MTRGSTSTARAVNEKRLRTEKHLGMSIEDWRMKKRQEWFAVMHAIERFAYGAAYTPTGGDFHDLQISANRIKESMAEDWVCW